MVSTLNLLSYPHFVPNQVLRSSDLNSIVRYLDQQNRLTRSYLFGMGIVSGLDLKWNTEEHPDKLAITAGIGLSSLGYLFDWQTCVLGTYSLATVDIDEIRCPEDIDDPEKTYEFWELSPEGGESAITAEWLRDMVIMLFWDEEQSIRETCFNDCEEGAGEVNIAIRAFAISRDDACELTKGLCTGNDGGNPMEALPEACLNRFGFTENYPGASMSGIHLPSIKDFQLFFNNYKENIERAARKDEVKLIKEIISAYQKAAESYAGIFGINEDFSDLEPRLQELLGIVSREENRKGIQYLYDYVKDLVLAYEEFADTPFAQKTVQKPDPCRFPYHILLGMFVQNGGSLTVDEDYRTELIRPPVEGLENADFDEAKHLFERMVELTKGYLDVGDDSLFSNVDIPVPKKDKGQIKITPSKGKMYDLSQRAIPYYYRESSVNKKDAVLRKLWNFREYHKSHQDRIPGYYPVTELVDQVEVAVSGGWLLCDMDAYDFFRIEGHLFRNLKEVLAEIQDERLRLNVPFDVRCLKLHLDRNFLLDEESAFLEGEYSELPHLLELHVEDIQHLYLKCRMDLLCHYILNRQGPMEGGDLSNADTLRILLVGMATVAGLVNNYAEFERLYRLVFLPAGAQPLDCSLPVFQKIKEDYLSRLRKAIEQLHFHSFAAAHPGMEHLAGVNKGGTFLIVFTDSVTVGPDDRDRLITQLVATSGEEQLSRAGLEAMGDAELIKFARERIGRSEYIRPEVVADFCLPYLCCSKAPVIRYELHEPEPLLILTPDRYCEKDGRKPILVRPEGGSFVDVPWVEQEELADGSRSYYFNPGKVPTGEYDAEGVARVEVAYIYGNRYTVKGVSVYKIPAALVNRSEQYYFDDKCSWIGYIYTFTNVSENAVSIQWYLNGQPAGEAAALVHSVSLVGENAPFTVRLVAYSKDKVCQHSWEQTIDPACPPTQLLVESAINEPMEESGPEIPVFEITGQAGEPDSFLLDVSPKGGFFFIVGPGNTTGLNLNIYIESLQEGEEGDCSTINRYFVFNDLIRPEFFQEQGRRPLPNGVYQFTYAVRGCEERAPSSINVLIRRPVVDDSSNIRAASRSAVMKEPGQEEEKTAQREKAKSPAKEKESQGPPAGAAESPRALTSSADAEKEENNGFVVFNRRLAARREVLARLETDSGLAQTKTFREVMAFELFNGQNIPRLENRFGDVMNLAINSFSRASGERKEQYRQLTEIVLHSFCDKAVAAREDKLPDSTRQVFQEFLPRLKSKEVDVEAIGLSWNGKELKEATGAASADELESLFKNA